LILNAAVETYTKRWEVSGVLEYWNDGELEYRIIFTHGVSPFHHSITPILQVSSGKFAYFPFPNS